MGTLPRPTVPDGPVRVLFDELHELHHRAGWPSLRDMSREVGYSRTTISAAFSEPRVPRWGLFELIVEALGGDTEHFHRLWLAATSSESPSPVPPVPPVPPVLPDVPRQLPADVLGFTGRGAALAALDALAGEPAAGARIGVISGTAGVGKTALAVHWAHRRDEQFPDGQLYLGLRGYDRDSPVTPEEALESALRALGVDGAAVPLDRADKAARYRSTIAGRRMLVLLDNAGSVDQVRDLLPGDPSAMVLVTSRDALPALVARHGAQRVSLDLLPATDALALLRMLAGERVALEPAAAQRLVARTARLPLALRVVAELAQSRPSEPLAELVDELTDEAQRLDLLSAGDDEYTAVRAVFSWSARQLSDDVRRAFALLGVHPGADFDEDAAAALLGVAVRSARRILDALARTNLIDGPRHGRFSMHDLLRAYAGEQADELGAAELQHARGRLFAHYVAGAEGGNLAWLDAERLNLLAVANAAAGRYPVYTVALATSLARYLDGRAYYSDARALNELALAAARRSGDITGEATTLNLLGNVHRRLGHYVAAAGYHEEALRIHEGLRNRAGVAAARHGLGILAWRSGRYLDASDHLEQALVTFREFGDRVSEGHDLYVLGVALMKLGRYREALAHLELAVQVNRQIGERTGEGRALNNLGEILLRLDRVDEAADAYAAALTIAREVGNRAGEGVALDNLATVDQLAGRLSDALAGHSAALAICRDVGYRAGEADCLCGLGLVYRSLERFDEAIAVLSDAVHISASVGGLDAQAGTLIELGDTVAAAGRPAEAVEYYRRALGIADATGDCYELARAHRGLARVTPDPQVAQAHERDARDAFARLH